MEVCSLEIQVQNWQLGGLHNNALCCAHQQQCRDEQLDVESVMRDQLPLLSFHFSIHYSAKV